MKSSRFHIEDGKLIKTSNGQAIPEDEPVVIIRGRDHLALPLLRIYRVLSVLDKVTQWFLDEQDKTIAEFEEFGVTHSDRMKQPGITMGK